MPAQHIVPWKGSHLDMQLQFPTAHIQLLLESEVLFLSLCPQCLFKMIKHLSMESLLNDKTVHFMQTCQEVIKIGFYKFFHHHKKILFKAETNNYFS